MLFRFSFLCCVCLSFILFFISPRPVSNVQCFQSFWIVYSLLPLRFSLTFMYTLIYIVTYVVFFLFPSDTDISFTLFTYFFYASWMVTRNSLDTNELNRTKYISISPR